MTGEARPYAASLTRLFELCSARRRQLLATGMADRASHLGERIEALLRTGRDFAPRVSLVRVALGAVILLGLVFAGARAPHWVAFAQEPDWQNRRSARRVGTAVPPVPLQAASSGTGRASGTSASGSACARYCTGASTSAEDTGIRRSRKGHAGGHLSFFNASIEQRSRTYTPAHPDMVRLAEQIRAAQVAMQLQKAQMAAMQAQMQVQLERRRADEQNRAAAPGGSFLAALVAAGYGDLSVDDIIELRSHGVSGEFLRALSQTGQGKLSTKELIALTDNGVRPDLIQALRQAFPKVTVREIIEAAQQGVRPEDLRQAKEFSPNLTLPQIIRLKQAGVI